MLMLTPSQARDAQRAHRRPPQIVFRSAVLLRRLHLKLLRRDLRPLSERPGNQRLRVRSWRRDFFRGLGQSKILLVRIT